MQISSSSTYITPQENKKSTAQPQNKQQELSTLEKQLITKLQAIDSEVRSHEAAHKAAGGGHTGAVSFSYQRGPDGKMYATGGEVPISLEKGSTPEQTIANARQVVAAAMAPSNPSPQDYAVASNARTMEAQAQQELVKELQQQQNSKNGLKIYAQNAQT